MVLYRQLFELPSGVHPYATYDATSKEIERVMLPDCKTWYKQNVTPNNAMLVVAGDINPTALQHSVARIFGKRSGNAPTAPSFFNPMPPNELKLFLVDRPGSTQAEVFVATLGPELQSEQWAPFKVGNQVLGGGVAGRLFLDVREQRSLAYRAFSSVESVAHGPAPIVLRAGTQTAKAGLTLQALLEHVQRMGDSAPTNNELQIATRYLSDVFLLRVETTGSLADMTAQLGVLGLPDDYYDSYRSRVSKTTADQVKTSSANFDAKRVIVVVAGDAQVLTTPLSHFAKVNVIEPDKSFAIDKIVPQNAAATLELQRMD
jgi:predicted Zn-dependent peptidase